MRLRELREDKNLSQEELAKAIETSQTNIGRWEKGLNEPSYRYVILLADYFGVTTDYLLGREDDFGNIQTNANLTQQEEELLRLFKLLPEIRRRTILDTLKFMTESSANEEQRFKNLTSNVK